MLKKIKPKSEFSRNVLTLMTGTTIAQAIPIAISPILTRLYTPEDFGVFALYMSISALIASVATGRYELAIMLPRKKEDAVNVVVLSIVITFIISVILLGTVFLFNEAISKLLGSTEISNWLYFIPFTIAFTGMYQSLNYWSNRKKHYKRLATIRVVQSSTTAFTNLGMGLSQLGSGGLILGNIFGQGIATLVLGKKVLGEDKALLRVVKKKKIFALMKKYKKLPIFNAPNALIDGIRLAGIHILIIKFFTVTNLGQFSLAWKMVQLPSSLIGSSLSQVFFQKVASVNKDELNVIVKKFIGRAIIVSAPIFTVIYFYAIDIFIFLFGENWRVAGEIASILSPWIFFNFISSPLSILFIVLHKEGAGFIFSIIYMMVPLGTLYFFHEIGMLILMKYISILMSIMLIVFIVLSMYYTKYTYVKDKKLNL